MKRIQGHGLHVHFLNPADKDRTLCGQVAGEYDMYGEIHPFKETSKLVNCPHCATVYCAVKNEPWNTQTSEPFEPDALDHGIYAAVSDGKSEMEELP